LVDDGVVGKILRLADVRANERVLEVGPGIGTLTLALLSQGAEVCAVEKDESLLVPLRESLKDQAGLTLVSGDALAVLSDAARLPFMPHKLVANLPYAVAATVVLDCFERLDGLASATVMVQREVAERMTAQPGSKDFGAYTVKLGLHARHVGSFGVARTSFLPPPRVNSTVIRLERHDKTRSGAGELQAAYLVAEAAFAQRRKTIRNSMAGYFMSHNMSSTLVDQLLEEAGIDPVIRGETLSLDEFQALAAAFVRLKT
jgi:16S rRNA (adenine1518-N6/adenine1519-N6)-dimethyltransferase